MSSARDNPIATQSAPALEPLCASHDADQLEAELKALFIDMFEQFVRPAQSVVCASGVPHIGPFELVERAVKAEGLALLRSGNEDAMRYVFRAWRGRNPKRGLRMLRIYLQLLWPGSSSVIQWRHTTGGAYPTELHPIDGPGLYLTSRVYALIDGSVVTSEEIKRYIPALRSVVPARVLLKAAHATYVESELRIAAGMASGAKVQFFNGNFE